MRTLDEVKEIIRKHKAQLRRRYKVKKIGVFGSLVRGCVTEDSDVDILVEFYEPISFFKFLELEEFLSEIIGMSVDLVSRKALKPHIGRNILQELVLI